MLEGVSYICLYVCGGAVPIGTYMNSFGYRYRLHQEMFPTHALNEDINELMAGMKATTLTLLLLYKT